MGVAPGFGLRDRLRESGPFLFSWLTLPGAALAGQMARLPFEGVALDLQHGLIGFSEAAVMAQAVTANARPLIVRTLSSDPGLVGQALDIGASVVIAPLINSASEAERLVMAAKYPPRGGRSWGGYAGVQASGLAAADYLAQANDATMVFAMIETRLALSRVREIAAVPGLDGLFVGPNDLSIALSGGEEIATTGPDTIAAMKEIASAARANGLVPGAFAGRATAIPAYERMGYRFLAAATDIEIMRQGALAILEA